MDFSKGVKEAKTSLSIPVWKMDSKKITADLVWSGVKGASGYELVVSTNSKFTKNKKTVTAKAGAVKKTVTIKGKFNSSVKIYAKMRPYTRVNGKKVYGRWSKI